MKSKHNLLSTRSIIATLVGGAFLLSGCSVTDSLSQKAGEKILEKTIESQTGNKVDINSENGQMNVQTDQGTMSINTGGSGKLPENFPSDMFTYSDAKIIFSLAGAKGTNDYTVTYQTATSFTDAANKYKQEMTGSGWTKESELNMGAEEAAMLTFKKGLKSVAVSIGKSTENDSLGKTTISLTGTEESTDPSGTAEPVQE